ncbi:MAG: CNNM domain-containing protein [Desulfomonile sp.]
MTVVVLVVIITLLISFHCSLFEAILYSTRLGTLEASKASGQNERLAEQFIEMKKRIDVPIASLLILNTVANTSGATISGYLAAEALGASMVPLFSLVFTLLVLFLGEIMPKTLGAVYWRRLWPVIIWPLTVMKYTLYPAILVTQQFSNLFIRGKRHPHITEDEILAAVRIGASEGEITHGESLLVHNIIHLENKAIREIMTPRTVIFSLDADMTVQNALKAVDGKGFTRIPIYEGDRENIIGYIVIHDLFSVKTLKKPNSPIKTIARAISFAPATRNSLALLTSFLRQRRHIAIVVDEYGGVAGLVTLEDLIETLLGDEIVDETDRVVDLQERARQNRPQRPTY